MGQYVVCCAAVVICAARVSNGCFSVMFCIYFSGSIHCVQAPMWHIVRLQHRKQHSIDLDCQCARSFGLTLQVCCDVARSTGCIVANLQGC